MKKRLKITICCDKLLAIWEKIGLYKKSRSERKTGESMKAFLILEDGTVFTGTSIGSKKEIILGIVQQIIFNQLLIITCFDTFAQLL